LTNSKENVGIKKAKLNPGVCGTPAYRSTLLREQKRKALGTVDENAVLIDITTSGNDSTCPDKTYC